MGRIYDQELAEVNAFLDQKSRAKQYYEFQEFIRSKLCEFSAQMELAGRVHEVTSRATSSPEQLKSRKKIALKLRKWRKDKPKTAVSDIHDIAGVTVDCPYPSDVKLVVDFINNNKDRFKNEFTIFKVHEIERPDYRAIHLELDGKGKYLGYKAELQIKTVFAKGWGLKTHDLIYKPPGDIDRRLQSHIDKLGHIIAIVDDQSEIVKSLIEQAWSLDRKRRDVAQKSLLSSFGAHIEPALQGLLDFWHENEAEIGSASVGSDIVVQFDDRLAQYRAEHGLNHGFCRIVCIYALSRPLRDRNDLALAFIDDWMEGLDQGSAVYKNARSFLCNVLMALGEYEECIQRSKDIVTLAELTPEEFGPILAARLNHAYYLSEAYYHRAFDEPLGGGQRDTEETEQCRKGALECILTLRDQVEASPRRNQLLDTIGAVLITCGETEEQVREGLKVCQLAAADAKGKDGQELLDSFFALHERRAFVRLVQFD